LDMAPEALYLQARERQVAARHGAHSRIPSAATTEPWGEGGCRAALTLVGLPLPDRPAA